ncbi:MAG: L,D-transpeptidase family protein [Bacteroidota bacterium]
MNFKYWYLIVSFLFASLKVVGQEGFKKDQKRYPRVRTAYAEKEQSVKQLFDSKGISYNHFQVYLQIFKADKKVQLWVKSGGATTYQLLKTYEICSSSGEPGPKRQQGDYQVPEGFYFIDRFNPASSFYLSMGLNYPNQSDRILGVKGDLGGDIFIHGDCVTIGCVPLTDEWIKELYTICVEAKDKGQRRIPVTVFPAKMSGDNYQKLIKKYGSDEDKRSLWAELKTYDDLFRKYKKLPKVSFLKTGRHQVSK